MAEGLIKGTKLTFLKIINGKIARKTTEADPNAEKYNSRDGTESWYEFYKAIGGKITSIGHKAPPEQHKDWAPNWLIFLKAGENNFQLQIPEGSGYARAFFCILPNIDPEQSVTITPQEKETVWNGVARNSRTVFINQAGEALSWFYKKDDMKDLPPVNKIEMKGKKTVYDDYDQNEFFKKLMTNFNSELSMKTGAGEAEPEPEEPEAKQGREAYDEDLPF